MDCQCAKPMWYSKLVLTYANTSWAVIKSKSHVCDPIWSQISNVPAHYLRDVSKFKYHSHFGAGERWYGHWNILLQNKLRCEFRLLSKVCAHTLSKINTRQSISWFTKGKGISVCDAAFTAASATALGQLSLCNSCATWHGKKSQEHSPDASFI